MNVKSLETIDPMIFCLTSFEILIYSIKYLLKELIKSTYHRYFRTFFDQMI